MIRLLKPLDYYYDKYGSWQYGLDKLYLLMEKQHNRGQEGAGLAAVKLEASAGNEFIFRERATGSGAIDDIFGKVHETFRQFAPEKLNDIDFVKASLLQQSFSSGISDTALQEKAERHICIPYCDETIGRQEVLHLQEISI